MIAELKMYLFLMFFFGVVNSRLKARSRWRKAKRLKKKWQTSKKIFDFARMNGLGKMKSVCVCVNYSITFLQ